MVINFKNMKHRKFSFVIFAMSCFDSDKKKIIDNAGVYIIGTNRNSLCNWISK